MAVAKPTAREMTRPDFPTSVFAYSDALRLLRAEGVMTAEQIAAGTDRVPSNVRRDVHKLLDADVIEKAGDGWRLTDKGAQWVQGMDVAAGDYSGVKQLAYAPGDTVALRLDQLRPDPENPRRHFDADKLEAMARSIAARGVIQNLLVRPASPLPFDDLQYPGEAHVIISGERRWRSARLAAVRGLLPDDFTVTCKIATPEDEAEALETAVVENMQRDDLSHLEQSDAFERLALAGRSNRQIAEAVGRTPEYVQQHRRLQRLDGDQRLEMEAGRLTLHEALKDLRTTTSPAATEPEPDQPSLDLAPDAPPAGLPGAAVADDSAARPDPIVAEIGDPATDPDACTLTPRAQLALIELAHKVAAQKLSPGGETWSGDAEKNYPRFVATVGKYWLDKAANELVAARLAAFMMRPGGLPPVAVVARAGVAWLLARSIPLPVSEGTLQNRQIMLQGVPVDHHATYHTEWLQNEVAPAAQPVAAAPDEPRDLWGRPSHVIAEDRASLDLVAAWVRGEHPDRGFAEMWEETGLAPSATLIGAADGAIKIEGPGYEIATVDVNRDEPSELVDARAMLIAWAVNRALAEGQG